MKVNKFRKSRLLQVDTMQNKCTNPCFQQPQMLQKEVAIVTKRRPRRDYFGKRHLTRVTLRRVQHLSRAILLSHGSCIASIETRWNG